MTHTGKLAIFNQSDEGGISYTRRYSSIQDQPCPLSCSSVSFYLYRRRRSFRIDTTTSVVPSLRRQQQTRRWYTAAGGSLDGAIMRCNCGHGSRTTQPSNEFTVCNYIRKQVQKVQPFLDNKSGHTRGVTLVHYTRGVTVALYYGGAVAASAAHTHIVIIINNVQEKDLSICQNRPILPYCSYVVYIYLAHQTLLSSTINLF